MGGGIKKGLTVDSRMLSKGAPAGLAMTEVYESSMQSFGMVKGEVKEYISNDIKCNSSLLNHPGSSTAFRIKGNQFDIVYASDVEANEKAELESIINFSKGSNYIFIDSSYTDKELSKRRGWGHLSFKQVLEVSKKIKPTEVLIFHHDFLRTDKELKLILNDILKKSENIQVCKEKSIFYFK